jgi:acyl carrier protein
LQEWDEVFEAMLRPHLELLEADSPLVADLDLRDAGVDSLALVEILVSIEDTYEVEFPDELLTVETFRTPGSLWAALCTVRSTVGAPPAG